MRTSIDNNPLILRMMEYYTGDPKRIQHYTKVYTYASMIGAAEHLPEETQHILETASIVHDIGIKIAEEKYHSSAGPYQEKEGPAAARAMLTELGYEEAVIDRVCYLVGRHHTYTDIDGADYQILVEADFLVNLYESQADRAAIENAVARIFKTKAGTQMAKTMFDL